MRLVVLASTVALISSLGCVRARTPAPTTPNPISNDYIDLQPGWRIRVVTPITKSGAYVLHSLEQRQAGNTVEMRAPDLIGYEDALYTVRSADDARLRVQFKSAEISSGGAKHSASNPRLQLFRGVSPRACCIRLLFLTRVSGADHEAAIVSAETPAALQAKTEVVDRNPESACHDDEQSGCFWVPAGISVQPQRPGTANGKKQWVPAR